MLGHVCTARCPSFMTLETGWGHWAVQGTRKQEQSRRARTSAGGSLSRVHAGWQSHTPLQGGHTGSEGRAPRPTLYRARRG